MSKRIITPFSRGETDMTRLKDVIVPEIFTGYVQTMTAEKSALIQSGAVVMDPRLSANLAGAGLTFNEPFYNDLKDEDEDIATDKGPASTPSNITTGSEVQVRMSRSKSWGSADLVSALIGNDPMDAIANRVSAWWTRRLQKAFIATMKGVFASNDKNNDKDLTFDASGSSFVNNVTNFTSSAFINAQATMGDASSGLGMIMVHSTVRNRMRQLNLIDFIPDARGEVNFEYYQGLRIIEDDSMPHDPTTGQFESWMFGGGAVAMGAASPKVPTAVERDEKANNGAGEEVLHNRVEWCIHPVGHAWAVSTANTAKGGPSNAATTGNLAHADSWRRAFAERKQIKIARLITREYAPL
ncbi:major capsid protein [Hafnia phage yong3]|nr:major capsid protein [Hafnia phage yong3]